jgi:cytoskeleton protein RodZ
MKKTGELLKKVREDKGLSLHEIGLSLKINAKILKQIEDGEKDNLPAKTFLRGFVQSYANYLKLDSDEVLRIFSEEMGSTKPQQIPTGSNPDSKNSVMTISEPKADGAQGKNSSPNYSKNEFEFKNFGIGFLVILLLLSLIGVRKVVEKYQKESEIEAPKTTTEETTSQNPIPTGDANSTVATSPADVSTADDIQKSEQNKPNPLVTTPEPPTPGTVTAPTSPATATQPIAQTHKLNSPATPVTSPAPTAAATNTKPGAVNPAVVPSPSATVLVTKPVAATPALTTPAATTNKPALSTTIPAVTKPTPATITAPTAVSPTTTTEKPSTVATKPPEEVKKPKSVEVVIEALDSVDVEVTLSSGKSEIIKLSPSQTQTIKSAAGVKLNFSNGGAVNLIVNGKDMGPPGDLGKPKKVSF